jgi:hypothetical protein
MPTRKGNTRALRQLADDLLRSLLPEDVPDFPRQDFVTSLVRQWITYDGHATLFVGDDQVYARKGTGPLQSRVPSPFPHRLLGNRDPAFVAPRQRKAIKPTPRK